ncbi:MAG: S8 family serine peptidase [Desulfurococcaceae archaeon TW002]
MRNRFISLLVILLLLAPTVVLVVTPTTALSSLSNLNSSSASAYISPTLYNDNFWKYGAYVEDAAFLSFKNLEDEDVGFEDVGFNVVNNDAEVGRVIIVLDKTVSLSSLRGKVGGLLGVFPTHLYNVVLALISRDDLAKLASTKGVLAILPDIRIDALINKEMEFLRNVGETIQELNNAYQATEGGSYHYTLNITKSIDVWLNYGIMGENVKLSIIDTGVDYGSPGLGLDAIARDEYGYPLVFDVSSLGLVLTPVEAVDTGDGYIYVDPDQLYVFSPPYYVFKWTNSLYVEIVGCRSYVDWPKFPVDNKWYVGEIPRYGVVKFGLLLQFMSTYVGGTLTRIWYTIPVIVIDSDGDRFYDTLYADTSTALYLLGLALSPPPCNVIIPGAPTIPDFSFADETPIRYGNEIIARDLNEDGITDYSIGTLAGYVYDAAFAILLEKIDWLDKEVQILPPLKGYRTTAIVDVRDVWEYEPVAMVWPGLDPYGDYVVIQYDFHSHGTFCATTAAGRDYYASTGYGTRSIAGQAPKTKIAAAPALYYGTVVVSIYFFSGFDLVTPYGVGSVYIWPTLLTNPWIAFEGWDWSWDYIGEHQVDMTSNSYGASGWALWGWASGMDPSSAIFDYTTIKSETTHFVAIGNGGPGWGTIASPGSSTLAVSVGAATEFTYRPIYGYYWPGSSRQVISWSNRGPTEFGVVKPDIVAVGSFAWAVGRTWEALGLRTFNGNLVHRLFSGTSQATPMTAGVGALVVSAYKSLGNSRMPPYLLKTILMNTAQDMGFDELSQGAGFVDAYKAVTAVMNPSFPRVYSPNILNDLISEMGGTYSSITYEGMLNGTWYEPKIFIPYIRSGYRTIRQLIIDGTGSYKVYPIRLQSTDSVGLCDMVLRVIDPAVITSCSGEDLVLKITAATIYGHLVIDMEALKQYDFFEIEAVFPFEYFESGGRTGNFSVRIPNTVLELAYWIDVGGDGKFSWLETARISYDIRGANTLRIQIGDLEGRIEEIENLARVYMGVDPEQLPRYLVVRIGVTRATYRGDLPIKARVVGYKYVAWGDVRVIPSRFTSLGSVRTNVIVRGPAKPGFYSGYIVVEETTRSHKFLVPISFFVPIELRTPSNYVLSPYTEASQYRNTYLRGAFDYTWRYESGDWRVFKIYVSPTFKNLWALGLRVLWPTHDIPTYASNVDVHLYGPYTYYMVEEETGIVRRYRVTGVQLAAELSRDPRGWGDYNPTRFWDSVGPGESLIISPVTPIETYRPLAETYRVVVRNIQFSGRSYEEPFTLELIPITLDIKYSYTAPTRTGVAEVTVTGPSNLLPSKVAVVGDGIVRPLGMTTYYYIPNLSEYGITLTISQPVIMDNTYKFKVIMTFSPNVNRGYYIIPLNAIMSFPVTTVGYIDSGRPKTDFMWYTIPIYLKFTLDFYRIR